MPLIEDAFQKYLIKTEKNGTTDGISTDRGRFIDIFNESQNRWIEIKLQNRGIDDVRYIEKFLVLDKKISDSSKTFDKFNFKLPDNYLDLSSVRPMASTKECKFFLSIYMVNNNTLSVYVDDFSVDYILLNYYRYPVQIRLIDNEDPESLFNENYAIEWDDKNLDRILSICAGDFKINESDPSYQLQYAKIQQ